MWYKNIAGRFFGLVTKHGCDTHTDGQTDRRTDGPNYNSQDCASRLVNKNSSGDEIVNMNFYAVRPEATRIR